MPRLGRCPRAVSLALAFALTTARAGAARAAGAEDQEAEALIARGIELREQSKDDEALALFKMALAKSPTPRARAQVALAEQALGLWVAAERDLALALAADDDPWITKNRAAIDGALAVVRGRLGSLEVRGTAGAEVLLDGVPLGTLPASAAFRVEAGRRTLELRARGFHATSRAIEVPAAGVARETVMLVAMAPGGGRDEADAAAEGSRSPVDDAGGNQRLLGWAFAATGGALGITGTVALLVRKGIVEDYNDQCPGLGVGQPPDCAAKIDSAHTWLTVSIVSFIAGGVFGVGGLTLVATAPRPVAAAASGLRIGCAPSAGLGGRPSFTCSGSF